MKLEGNIELSEEVYYTYAGSGVEPAYWTASFTGEEPDGTSVSIYRQGITAEVAKLAVTKALEEQGYEL